MATTKQVQAAKRNVKKTQRNLPGRSKMGRDELAAALGRK